MRWYSDCGTPRVAPMLAMISPTSPRGTIPTPTTPARRSFWAKVSVRTVPQALWRIALLPLVAVAFAMIALGGMQSLRPWSYAVYWVVVFVWLGVAALVGLPAR